MKGESNFLKKDSTMQKSKLMKIEATTERKTFIDKNILSML